MTKTFSLVRFVSMIELLSWNNLSYSFDKTITLSFPDGSIHRGESLAIIGSSGSGKSTWLQLLSGILPLQSGEVHFDSHPLHNTSRRERDQLRSKYLGIVFQKNHFLENLTIQDNLSLPSYAQKSAFDTALVNDLCEKLKVFHLLDKKPRDCSVGELQRLSIIRTMSTRPSFILADEPTSALDDKNAEAILEVFETIQKSMNVGIIIVTHDQRVKSRVSNVISFTS